MDQFVRVGVGGVIISKNNEILLLQRRKSPEKDYWSIPGGSVEYGETLEEAVIREIEEEVGLNCEVVQFLCYTDQIIRKENTHWLSVSFLLRIISGDPVLKEDFAHKGLKWYSMNELPNNITMATRDAIKFYLK